MVIPTNVCLLRRKAHAQYDIIMDGRMIAYLEYVCICMYVPIVGPDMSFSKVWAMKRCHVMVS